MATLLIADRDPNERNGISWLVTSYAIPYEHVAQAESAAALFACMEAQRPEVLCVELDMVSKEEWERLRVLVSQYGTRVVVMTAEATFARAMQGIDLHAWDLWVKPLSPDQIRHTLTRLCRTGNRRADSTPASVGGAERSITYRDLFLPGVPTGNHVRLMLFQLEQVANHPQLLAFLEAYPFRQPPVLLPLSDLLLCIFADEEEEGWKRLEQLAKRLLADWEAAYGEPLFILLYEADDPALTLHEKYLTARQAAEIRFFKGYRQISLIRNRINWQMIDPFLSPAEQRFWVEKLNNGDREAIKQWMYQQFLKLAEPFPEPGRLRTRLTSILAQVRRYMKSFGLDKEGTEERYHQVFATILYTPILYRIVQELLLFVYEVMGTVSAQLGSYADVIEQAIRYMEENYRRAELRLEDVARHVDRSPAYLSSLFTKRLGISFRQQLMAIRLKEAQRLLLESTLSIQEIADQTGFVNVNYFSKIFKERLGTTPRAFRNRKKG